MNNAGFFEYLFNIVSVEVAIIKLKLNSVSVEIKNFRLKILNFLLN